MALLSRLALPKPAGTTMCKRVGGQGQGHKNQRLRSPAPHSNSWTAELASYINILAGHGRWEEQHHGNTWRRTQVFGRMRGDLNQGGKLWKRRSGRSEVCLLFLHTSPPPDSGISDWNSKMGVAGPHTRANYGATTKYSRVHWVETDGLQRAHSSS